MKEDRVPKNHCELKHRKVTCGKEPYAHITVDKPCHSELTMAVCHECWDKVLTTGYMVQCSACKLNYDFFQAITRWKIL